MPKTTKKDFLISFRVPKATQEKYSQWVAINNLTDKSPSEIGLFMLDVNLEKTPFLSPELKKQVEHLLIDGNSGQKIAYIMRKFFEFHEKFPYLNIQRTITPEEAGFLPNLPCVKAIYWENKFLGFQCIMRRCPIDLPRISLKDSQGHRITLKIATAELCLTCVKLFKKHKVGMDFFKGITLENIFLYEKQRKEQAKPKHEIIIREKLQNEGFRMDVRTAKGIFKIVRRPNRTNKARGVTKASQMYGISRPTIYKLLKAFPDGLS